MPTYLWGGPATARSGARSKKHSSAPSPPALGHPAEGQQRVRSRYGRRAGRLYAATRWRLSAGLPRRDLEATHCRNARADRDESGTPGPFRLRVRAQWHRQSLHDVCSARRLAPRQGHRSPYRRGLRSRLERLGRYPLIDATLGLAFAATGVLYPFFGTLLGWLGVALTGSDTASNILFGNLQRITSEQLGLSSVLMAAANSSGGVMGKMIDAQSIVVASTATNWYGHEGSILRYVFLHSIVLACLVGVLVTLQAYVYPFTEMVLK